MSKKDPVLDRFGLTEAQAKTLAKLHAGRNVSGGMAGVALERKGLVAPSEGHAPGAIGGWIVTDKGRATLCAIRARGW